MTSKPLQTDGCDALTVGELHAILGLKRDRVRQSLKVRNPEFVQMCSGDDPAQLERVRQWYINEIGVRGGIEDCREATAIRELLKRKRRFHMVSWKSLATMLDVRVDLLDAVSQGRERDIAKYREVAGAIKLLPTFHPRSRVDGIRVSKKTAGDESAMRGRSIRRRRVGGYLSSAFVAQQCGLTKEQLCEVEMGRADPEMTEHVSNLLATMLGENLI